ncbi:MAG TPA: hypothetical protein VIR30_10010 [Nocardioides sp.]
MRLLWVELTRLRWRRAVLLLSLAAFVLPTLMWAGTTWSTRPVSDSEVATAKAQARESAKFQSEELDRCAKDPKGYAEEWGGPPDATCEDLIGTPADPDSDYVNYLERQPMTFSTASDTTIAAAVLVVVMMLLAGATFAGADWSSGSMSNQLLFESRRGRVWLAKVSAAFIGGFVVAALALAFLWVLFTGLFALRDVTVTSADWQTAGARWFRASLTAAMAAVGGCAMTMLFRNTIATLGLMVAVIVSSSVLIFVLPFLADPEPWTVHANGLAVLQGGYEYYPPEGYSCDSLESCNAAMLHVSMTHGIVYFAVILAVTLTASVLSFRRRDVP